MVTLVSLLMGRQFTDPNSRRRSWQDHILLFAVILLTLVALRYLHGVGGPTAGDE
jgi:hypothetical protein